MAAQDVFTEKGHSGLQFTVQGGLVEEEYLPQLMGKNAIKVFREMSENDPVVKACLFAIDMLIRGVDWTAEAAKLDDDANDEDKAKADENKVFLEECMDDMSHSWSDFVSEIMSMIRFGFSFFEIVYKKRNGYQKSGSKMATSKYSDGKVGWRKFAIRSQDTLSKWVFDKDGGVIGFEQNAAPDYTPVVIPMEKGLLFRTTTFKNNPEGESCLRAAYRPWFYKKRIEEIEGVGIERDLAGLPFAEVDPSILSQTASDDEKALLASIQTMMKNIRRDKQEGVIWPRQLDENGNSLYEFKLLNSGGTRQFDTNQIIERYDKRITMSMLADFIMLGHSNVGSFALSSDKTDLFAVALGAWLKAIEDVLNRFAVPRLFEMNGMDTQYLPTITHGDIEKPDINALATTLATLASLGMPLFPDEDLESWVREIVGMPEVSAEAKEAHEQQQKAQLASLQQEQQDQDPAAQEVDDGADPEEDPLNHIFDLAA